MYRKNAFHTLLHKVKQLRNNPQKRSRLFHSDVRYFALVRVEVVERKKLIEMRIDVEFSSKVD